jgi:hypothetical protein
MNARLDMVNLRCCLKNVGGTKPRMHNVPSIVFCPQPRCLPKLQEILVCDRRSITLRRVIDMENPCLLARVLPTNRLSLKIPARVGLYRQQYRHPYRLTGCSTATLVRSAGPVRRVVVFKFQPLYLVFLYLILIHVLVFNLAPSKFIRFQFWRRQWLPFRIVHLFMLPDAQ